MHDQLCLNKLGDQHEWSGPSIKKIISKIDEFKQKNPLEFNDLFDLYECKLSVGVNRRDIIILERTIDIPRYSIVFLNANRFVTYLNSIFLIISYPYKKRQFLVDPSTASYRFEIGKTFFIKAPNSIGGLERYGNDPFFTDAFNVLIKIGIFSSNLEINR